MPEPTADQAAQPYGVPNDPRYFEVLQFLYEEAHLLDHRRFRDWLALLTDDISYRVPARQNRRAGATGEVSDETAIFAEDMASLKVRVDRLGTTSAWAEDPPSRTRHLVSNVRLRPAPHPEELEVESSILVYRGRSNQTQPDIFCGERHDVLRKVEGAWRLARRTVVLDQVLIGARHLSVFL